jgi:penicillin G amidase
MSWTLRLLALLIVLPTMAAAGLGIYAWRALPISSGTLVLPGAQGEITIDRDAHGVPTVRAGNLRDLAFGTGVVHAQDRLWQLETHRRIGSGRLAEALGPAALETDRFLRALGVRRTAAAQWDAMKGEARETVLAYTAGINAVMAEGTRARPPEFMLLGLPLEPWTPVDTLAWAIMMAWDLGGNWTTELLRLRLSQQMPVERIDQLLPPYPGESPPLGADYAALYRSLNLSSAVRQAWVDLPALAPESGIEGVGSNNWVLAGSRTTTGRPLLANDPHLKLSAPALWYFVRLESPQLKVAGASMPGVPGIVLGQNEHLAWGFTNTGPDVQDLYIEQVRSDDPGQYRTPDGWAPFESVQEVIKVKGEADVAMTVRRTRHGPVISDAGSGADLFDANRPAYVLALQWTALAPDMDNISPSLALQATRSVPEFVAAVAAWKAPMQNMAVADREGRIGVVSAGQVPLRRVDNDLHGRAPAPGWDARYDWAGWVPADRTPRRIDPAGGALATANQRIHEPDYPYFIGSDWALPYRQQRIEQLLASRPRHSIDDLAAMQADQKSLATLELLPVLRQARSSHALAAAVAPLLASFDGEMAANDAAPLIYWAWLRQLKAALFSDDLGSALWQRSLGRSFFAATVGVMARDDASWCDDRSTVAVRETCAMINDLALTRALDELQARLGSDVSRWKWGELHQARSEHRPFSRVKLLAPFFELRSPVGGDTYTINVSRVGLKPDATTGEMYLDEHGPSLRALYDLGDPSQSRVMHSTGQSGLFFSPLYRAFVKAWTDVRYLPLWAAGEPERRLRVLPKAD